MTASAITSVNGNAQQIAHIVTYGSTVNLALTSLVNVQTVTFRFISDNFGSETFPTVVPGVFGSATFAAPADPLTGSGWGFLVQTTVNENTPTQAIYRFIVGATNTGGVVPITPDETFERHPRLGWLYAFYQIVAAAGGGLGDLGDGNIIIGGPSGNQIRHAKFTDITVTENMGFAGFRGVNAQDPVDPQDVDTKHARDEAIANLTLDDIGPAYGIASFAVTGTSYAPVVEIGTTIGSITSSATYNSGPPTGASIADNLSGSWSTSSPFASGSRSTSVYFSGISSWTTTLTATKGSKVKIASVTVNAAARQYWGVGAAGLTAAQVQALGNYQLTVGLIASFTVSPSNQKVYLLTPQAFGVPDVWLGGLRAAFNTPQSVTVTRNGVTLNYYLLETTYNQLGTNMVFYTV